ncbi:MAG: UDP-N-acetylmuramate dehydrogenase [Candidatus Pacebacteria bacterium]|jgi:UDP-N-acetylmuramate dehydrogenase|nr:UDP-N-acetylmuramate dehydrogenase [Candidatus Paceibacterota bacterium]
MTRNQNFLGKHFPDINWSFNFPLAKLSYFKLGGPAEIFYKVEEIELVKQILSFCSKRDIPWVLVGGLSNVVLADAGVEGLVLEMACKGFKVLEDGQDSVLISAEAGMKTSQLVSKSVYLNATGLEGFIGVPGTVGGAIYNNAHYLDFLLADSIQEVTAFHVKNDEEIMFSHENCKFTYEQSIFQEEEQVVILSASFLLQKDDPALIKEKILEAQARRLDTQPLNYPSSGCIFRNPANNEFLKKLFPQFANQEFIPAGFLIDQAGLKNQREGAIVVSDKHAAFLINKSAELNIPASSADLKKLIKKIQLTIKEKFQVELKEEVFYLGKD